MRDVKEHPIIFSAPMVRAVLAGNKTQTRRLSSSPLQFVRVGDRLWVRENYRFGRGYDGLKPSEVRAPSARVHYEADGPAPDWAGKLWPSIFMPRWASRLTIDVLDVRFQKAQDISRADAIAEGATSKGPHWWSMNWPDKEPEQGWKYVSLMIPESAFANYWIHLHGDRSWHDNPEVVAITFKRVVTQA